MKRMDFHGWFGQATPGSARRAPGALGLVVGRGDDPADRERKSQYSIFNIQYSMINGNSRTAAGCRSIVAATAGCGDESRRGVALIVVLGFLSLMVMMAVAFLTQARVERMVAAFSLEGMRTRQVAQTAIAAAMQDYLNALKTVTPAETDHDIFLSGDNPGTISFYYSGQTLGDDRLVVGKVSDWLLQEHLVAAKGAGEDGIRNAEWIWVRQKPGVRSRILGRYAYACFNMSGLLDANLLGTAYGDNPPQYGDATNRNNVRKMVFEALDQEKGGDAQRKLNVHQDKWKGFDTPAALLNLTDGDWNDGKNQGPNHWTGTDMDEGAAIDVSLLAPYSYSMLHRVDGAGKEKILCTAASLAGDADFKELAGSEVGDVVKALTDYESGSQTPLGVNYPSVINVPMFNELGVNVGLTETPAGLGTNGLPASTYVMTLYMNLEFWYPFPSKSNERGDAFTMDMPKVGGSKATTGDKDVWVQMAGTTPTQPLFELATGDSTPLPAALRVSAKWNKNEPYYADNVNANGEALFTVPLTSAGGDPLLPAGMSLTVRNIHFSKPLTLTLGGTPVDSTALDKEIDFSFRGTAAIATGTRTAIQSLAVDDPRLNHVFSSWKDEGTGSFKEINKVTKAAKQQVAGIPPGDFLYCRNWPMQKPGELGYLPTSVPWQTLNIFSDVGIRLMGRLVCDKKIFNILESHNVYCTNGTINPYTRHEEVLNAAFYGIDKREVPEIDPTLTGYTLDDNRLDGGELTSVVEAMMEEKTRNGHVGWAMSLASGNLPNDLNKNNRIAILNNTWGLFHESDRLFVLLVVAQSIKEGDDPTGEGNWDAEEDVITGERRAVALCWLDGSENVGGDTLAQEMNIIMFQYLNE